MSPSSVVENHDTTAVREMKHPANRTHSESCLFLAPRFWYGGAQARFVRAPASAMLPAEAVLPTDAGCWQMPCTGRGWPFAGQGNQHRQRTARAGLERVMNPSSPRPSGRAGQGGRAAESLTASKHCQHSHARPEVVSLRAGNTLNPLGIPPPGYCVPHARRRGMRQRTSP